MSVLEPVIGLEVHAQLDTRSKIFCGCSTRFGAPPNRQTCPVCLGLPGTLPVANREAVRLALRLGLALGSDMAESSRFARKNYVYPDVPKNYQISQYEAPIGRGGAVEIDRDGVRSSIPLERIHLEEDAGKSQHDLQAGRSAVDLNRAGVPLIEIVTRPVLREPEEAGAFLVALRRLLRYLDVSDGNMEEGSLRCDANVSLRPAGSMELGTKVELKNLNSISGVVAALTHEIARQQALCQRGETLQQQTRGWDAQRGESVFLRGKEKARDYRYFPDPDLPPLVLRPAWREEERARLPELPLARLDRLQREYGLPEQDAQLLCDRRQRADWYEQAARAHADPKAVSNWTMGELMRHAKERGVGIEGLGLSPERFVGLLRLVAEGILSGRVAKEVLLEMLDGEESAESIVERRGLRRIDDPDRLRPVLERILDEHPEQLELWRGGKESLAGFFVGQLMRSTDGRAEPQLARRLVDEALRRRRT